MGRNVMNTAGEERIKKWAKATLKGKCLSRVNVYRDDRDYYVLRVEVKTDQIEMRSYSWMKMPLKVDVQRTAFWMMEKCKGEPVFVSDTLLPS